MTQRYDICHYGKHVAIEPHFCREWDENGGCYGTNPDHGYSWEEAKEQLISWHEAQIDLIKNMVEEE